jgi:putative ABC transport system substrate-binding protein
MKLNTAISLAGVILLLIIGMVVFLGWSEKEPPKVYKIGILVRGSGYEPAVEGYKGKMKELGYEEGRNVVYDIRFVSNREDLPKVAQEFVDYGVNLIHTYSTPATQAAYEITKDLPNPVPIVFGSMGDPLASGAVKGIQSSGTNVTGVASLSTELTAKRLELLKELFPEAKKVALPHTAREAGDVAANLSADIALDTAQELGVDLVLFPVEDRDDNKRAAELIKKEDVDGIIVGGDSLVWGSIEVYIEQAIKERLPLAVFDLTQVKKGALVGYGPDYKVSGEQSAILTDKILNGRHPSELPIEVPHKLILAFNSKTAQQIDLNASLDFLAKVDVFIEE